MSEVAIEEGLPEQHVTVYTLQEEGEENPVTSASRNDSSGSTVAHQRKDLQVNL